jgi:hypothetical protein
LAFPIFETQLVLLNSPSGAQADRSDERRVPSNGYGGEGYSGYGCGAGATILEEENEPELPGAAVETPMVVTHGDEERVKMTCHVCFSG